MTHFPLRVAIAIAVACIGARTADAQDAHRWQLDVQWWNDLFSDPPPADDQGFTNDFLLGVSWDHGATQLEVQLFHRMLTERHGARRWDQLELTAAASRARRYGAFDASAALVAGPSLGGNFAGCAIQNTWHRVTGSGITVDEGLQSVYDGDRRAALLIGAQLSGQWSHGPFAATSRLEGRAALGSTGVSRAAVIAGGRLEGTRFGAAVELALSRYHTRDPNLELRAGYGTGAWHLEPRLTLSARLGRYTFGWQLRANESGSDEPVGVLWLTVADLPW